MTKRQRGVKNNTRKSKIEDGYFLDFTLELLSWMPELLLLPFRLLFWLFRGLGRWMSDAF